MRTVIALALVYFVTIVSVTQTRNFRAFRGFVAPIPTVRNAVAIVLRL